MKKKSISVIIITKNCEDMIESCIKHVLWADEIIIVDNNSVDKTVQISQQYGARVLKSNSNSFAELRNIGKNACKTEWILYVDSDELVSKDLKDSIISTLDSNSSISNYKITRINYFFGKKWPQKEEMVRLFSSKSLLKWVGDVHESPDYTGPVSSMIGVLYHFTHRNILQMLKKTNEWSEIEAKLRYDYRHPNMNIMRFIRILLTGFWISYIQCGGWKVGQVGVIESMYQSYSLFITYAKLWELQIINQNYETK